MAQPWWRHASWRWRLVALCCGLNLVETVALMGFDPGAHPDLAPQASAIAPFGVFGDLRWVSVYNNSWAALGGELLALLVVRGLITAVSIALAWPAHLPRPAVGRLLLRSLYLGLSHPLWSRNKVIIRWCRLLIEDPGLLHSLWFRNKVIVRCWRPPSWTIVLHVPSKCSMRFQVVLEVFPRWWSHPTPFVFSRFPTTRMSTSVGIRHYCSRSSCATEIMKKKKKKTYGG